MRRVVSLSGLMPIRRFGAALAMLMNTFAAPIAAEEFITTYCNPTGPEGADPFVLKDGDTYYLYATGPTSRGYEVYESKDLVRWTNEGMCFEAAPGGWGQTDFWAPEVLKNGDEYIMYYTARHERGRRNICIAKAKSPKGPFVEVKGPMFPEISCIDPHAYRDPVSGEMFFYVVEEPKTPGRILVTTLQENLIDTKTSLTECMIPSQDWEDYWVEGPVIVRHKDLYYMMYSGGAWSEATYAVGYATSKSPAGPWTKYSKNPILENTEYVDGPGHNCVAESPDGKELFCVYHKHKSIYNYAREVAIDRIEWLPSGDGPDIMAIPSGPSITDQKLPSGAPLRKAARTDKFDAPELDRSVWSVHKEEKEHWRIENGELVVTMQDGDFWYRSRNGANVFLQELTDEQYSIRTKVTFGPKAGHEQASLVLWQDQDNFLLLSSAFVQQPRFEVALEQYGKMSVSIRPNEIGETVHFRLDVSGKTVRPFASADGKAWKELSKPVEMRFRPRKAGLGAWGSDSNRDATAKFSEFEVVRGGQ